MCRALLAFECHVFLNVVERGDGYQPRYELAYGAGGSPPKIPGHSVLIFRMEILKIKGSKALQSACRAELRTHTFTDLT